MRFLLILAVSLTAAASVFAQTSEFVGYRHKGVVYGEKLPNGLEDRGGGLLSDDRYGVTRYVKGKRTYLWLEKISERDSEGVPSWVVRDVLEFRSLGNRVRFLFSYSSACTLRGKKFIDLVVQVERRRRANSYRVVRAWRADLAQERFEPVKTTGIVCRFEDK